MLLSLEIPILPSAAVKVFFRVLPFLLWCAMPAVSQKAQPADILPKYDLGTEMKTKGVIEEINQRPVGPRKDFTELILKIGEDKVHIYVCPQPFQTEMGITFTKGDQIAVTGSKVKQEAVEIILAREMVKGTDTLMFRDGKGNPVWDLRTGK